MNIQTLKCCLLKALVVTDLNVFSSPAVCVSQYRCLYLYDLGHAGVRLMGNECFWATAYISELFYALSYSHSDFLLPDLSVQAPHHLQTKNNLVILPELESWTWYCVRVQCHEPYYNKKSVFSPIYCKQTEGESKKRRYKTAFHIDIAMTVTYTVVCLRVYRCFF